MTQFLVKTNNYGTEPITFAMLNIWVLNLRMTAFTNI